MVRLLSGTNAVGRDYFGTMGASRVVTMDPPFTADTSVAPTDTITAGVFAMPKSPTNSVPTTNAAAVEAKVDTMDTVVDGLATQIGTAGDGLTAITVDTARLTAARAGVLTDWINGGRLDLILDIIAADTTTDIPAILGAKDDAAATGVVTGTDSLMKYIKQLVTQNLNPAGFKKGEAVVDLSWPMVDGNGDVVTGETVAVTIQKDGGTPAALTGTIAEIGSTGNYQVTTSPALTTTEMNANHVYLVATSTNAKPQVMQFWPETRS